MMKYIVLILPFFSFAQLKVAENILLTNESTIFQVGDKSNSETNKLGFILPSVVDYQVNIDAENEANLGSIFFDVADKKVKYLEKVNTWTELTKDEGDLHRVFDAFKISSSDTNDLIDLANTNENQQKQGVIIGSETSNAQGILVLESNDKGFILPQIKDPHLNIPNPYPGFMCYDLGRGTLAVFNGTNWYYWK